MYIWLWCPVISMQLWNHWSLFSMSNTNCTSSCFLSTAVRQNNLLVKLSTNTRFFQSCQSHLVWIRLVLIWFFKLVQDWIVFITVMLQRNADSMTWRWWRCQADLNWQTLIQWNDGDDVAVEADLNWQTNLSNEHGEEKRRSRRKSE